MADSDRKRRLSEDLPAPPSARHEPGKDPSPNVYDLVRAAIERQDDLRQAESRHIRELAAVRAGYDTEMRTADRHDAELRAGYEEKLREKETHEADTRAKYEDRLREKETQRLDAIRAVDVATGTATAQAAEARATTLAAAQQASAEVLRNQLEQARITTAEALEARIAPLVKAVEDLRQAQYQQQGEKSSKVETSSSDRDAVAIEQARLQTLQTQMQASQARMQLIAVVIAAIVLAVGIYAAFHK